MLANQSDNNDIVEDIIQSDGRYIAGEREEETVQSFTSVQKPSGRVTSMKDMQKLSSPESHSTRADRYFEAEKFEDSVRKQSRNIAQPAFRDETDTEHARYKSETEEEPRRVKNIIRKLMALRTKKTDTRRNSNASLDTDESTNEKINICPM